MEARLVFNDRKMSAHYEYSVGINVWQYVTSAVLQLTVDLLYAIKELYLT